MKKLVLILLALTLAACQRAQPQSDRLPPLPQDPLLRVYFNHARSNSYVEPYRQQKRSGDDLEQAIVDTITTAKSTLDVAVQQLHLPKIAKALADRQKAGVKVRVILENTYSRPGSNFTPDEVAKLTDWERERYNEFRLLVDINRDGQLSREEINQRDALIILQNAGIPIIDDTADGSKGSGLMHHKFVVVDDRRLIVTSANFTTSDIHGDFSHPSSLGNANNLLQIESPELAHLFTEEFNLMWGDGPKGKLDSKFGVEKPFRAPRQVIVGNTIVKVKFSPDSSTIPWSNTSNGFIGETLNSSTKSVSMALFVFSEQGLANILERKNESGVQIRALIDPDFAYRSYSEALDMMGVALPNNCKYEVDNRPWRNPIATVGVPLLLKGDLLHHKFAVMDGETVITGSHNWSAAANKNNDETVLLIDSSIVAAHFAREFDRLYNNSVLGLPDGIKRKIETQQKQCPRITVSSPSPASSSLPKVIANQNSGKVNLNTATQAELEGLPGVGPKLALEIMKARQQKPFTSLEDLDKVPGVGPSLLAKLQDRVTW